MRMEDAFRLHKEWGDKPCDHKELSKESHLGASTGDLACTTCGLSMSPDMWENYRKRKHRRKSN
jgi:hypothetical protein